MVAMLAHSVRHADQKDVALANARLIAASPLLYAALEAQEEAERDEEIYHGVRDGIGLGEHTDETHQRLSELRQRMVESATKAKALRAAALAQARGGEG
jgi:hypothetical protein